jgi:hypothetical protein
MNTKKIINFYLKNNKEFSEENVIKFFCKEKIKEIIYY